MQAELGLLLVKDWTGIGPSYLDEKSFRSNTLRIFLEDQLFKIVLGNYM